MKHHPWEEKDTMGLSRTDEWLKWRPGYEKACLDGHFSADELISIGRYMKENKDG